MANEKKRFIDKAYDRDAFRDTKDFYAEWAETYDEEVVGEHAYVQPQRCAEALQTFGVPSSARILDVGCGTGLSGQALLKAGFADIDGCDFSQEMLDKAAEKNIYNRLFLADLNTPPLDSSDEAYDAAAAVGVFSFEHIDPNALDDVLRILKPGASLVIGLNDHFYETGVLETKLTSLEDDGVIEVLKREHGDHLPNFGVKGWLILLVKK
ncbi:MAG: methyltransferase domain-containing protein [Pseudomonadota bacterium]